VLDALGSKATYGGLLELANELLGGMHADQNGLLGAVNTAVSTINEAFDECRWVACPETQ
jgi:hypothetical protein